jgi:hypothetical protein
VPQRKLVHPLCNQRLKLDTNSVEPNDIRSRFFTTFYEPRLVAILHNNVTASFMLVSCVFHFCLLSVSCFPDLQPGWELRQQSTFLAWVNAKLQKFSPAAKQVSTLADLADGVALCQLLEVLLAPQKLPRWNHQPRMDAQRLDNLTVFFSALESSGLYVLTKPRNVLEGNIPMVLGLLWLLIYEYDISRTVKVAAAAAKTSNNNSRGWSRTDPRDALLDWLNSRIERSGVKARSFDGGSFQDGNVLLALTHSFAVDSFDLSSMIRMNSPEKICLALSTAQARFGIAALLDERALLNGECDEKSLMTYVIQFLSYEQELRSRCYQQGQFVQQQQQPQQMKHFTNPYSDKSVGNNVWKEKIGQQQLYPYPVSAPPSAPPPPYTQPPQYTALPYEDQAYPPQYRPQYLPPQQQPMYASVPAYAQNYSQNFGYQPYVYEPAPRPAVYLNTQPNLQYVPAPQYVVIKHKGKKYKHKKYKGGKRFGFKGFKGFKF